MKREDVLIVGLVIIVFILAAIAILVTGIGMKADTDAPFESSSSKVNTTNVTKNISDSANRDTGVTAPSGESSSSSSESYYSDSSSSGSSGYTPSGSDSSDSRGSDSGGSDSRGSDSGQGGQTPSDNVVRNLE